MIQLIKGTSNYMARYSGRDKAEIVKLFHTHTLPTPFLITSDIWEVAEKVQQLNPNINVIVY